MFYVEAVWNPYNPGILFIDLIAGSYADLDGFPVALHDNGNPHTAQNCTGDRVWVHGG